jgi:hypothetical protein
VQAWLGQHPPACALATYVHVMDDGAGDADFIDDIVAYGLERAADEAGANGAQTATRKHTEIDTPLDSAQTTP